MKSQVPLKLRGTSWRQITAASGAPAGSIGFLFPDGKESLASDVARAVAATTHDQIAELLGADADPVVALHRWIRASARVLERSDFTDGCPLATLALEMAHRSPRIQQEIATGYDSWTDLLADHLAPTHGHRSRDAAEIMLAAFEGALLLARARRDSAPLERLADNAGRILAALA